jgi:hypothetical protein
MGADGQRETRLPDALLPSAFRDISQGNFKQAELLTSHS